MVERRQWTRRGFIAGGAVALTGGAAGSAWLLSRRGDAPGPTSPPRTPSPAAPPTATPLPRGGVARIAAAARLNFDTFDPLRTVEPSVEQLLGRSLSRLAQWADFEAGTLAGDLAAGWEQVDGHTLAVTLDPAATWHDRPPLDGRAVTAGDVAAHFDRLLSLRSTGQLSAPLNREFALLERVTAAGDHTLVLETSAPDPLLLVALASRFALIAAPEAVDAFGSGWHDLDPTSVVGSGPFVYEGEVDGAHQFVRHPAAHRPPHLDGARLYGPHGAGEAARGRFLSRELDAFLSRDRRDTAALREAAPAARESLRLEEAPTISTVFAGAPPWSDSRLLLALSAALNRRELIERLHAGQAVAAGPVTPAALSFALPESDLETSPGYREDPATDFAEARALWETAGGPALGVVTIDVPTIYDPLFTASSVVTGVLSEVLGQQFVASLQSYPTISARAAARQYGNGAAHLWFGWGPPVDSPDPSRSLIETFRSGSPGWAPFGITLPALDSTLDQLAREFDIDARRQLVREASRHLLEGGGAGVLTWCQQTGAVFEWPALHRPPATPFWAAHLDAAAYLDPDADRPS